MNSAGTYYWTTPSGEQLSDTPGSSTGNEYIFFAGQRIAWVDSGGTVRYYWGDHLGTTRIVTDASGNVCYDADYYPFQGERTPYVSTCTPAYKFAGMKLDQESGDYYTLNRYYPPNLGRWMSPDPVAGEVTKPQSLNRYGYVLNNPMTFTDPLGLMMYPPFEGGGGGGCDPFFGCEPPCDPYTDPSCDPGVPLPNPRIVPPGEGGGGGGGGGGGEGTAPPCGRGAGPVPPVAGFLGWDTFPIWITIKSCTCNRLIAYPIGGECGFTCRCSGSIPYVGATIAILPTSALVPVCGKMAEYECPDRIDTIAVSVGVPNVFSVGTQKVTGCQQ
jgi:RHS repeat-associated protein